MSLLGSGEHLRVAGGLREESPEGTGARRPANLRACRGKRVAANLSGTDSGCVECRSEFRALAHTKGKILRGGGTSISTNTLKRITIRPIRRESQAEIRTSMLPSPGGKKSRTSKTRHTLTSIQINSRSAHIIASGYSDANVRKLFDKRS